MRTVATPVLFSLFLFFLFTGLVFKIQHWPGGEVLILVSIALEAGMTCSIVWEISSSKNVNRGTKMAGITVYGLVLLLSFFPIGGRAYTFGLWSALLLFLVPLIAGLIYLTIGRRKFAPKEREIDKIKFDSFEL